MSNEENRALKAHEEYRTAVETAAEYIENFDILETITNVGNDEVFTPRKICDMLLDSLPEEVWHNPNYKWLNPATKNGIFEREIAIRLDEGLKEIITDVEVRRKHILQNMIFAIGQTKFTANVARRTLYYCAKANQKCDGIKAKDGHYVNGFAIGNGTWFNDEEGNIITPQAIHDFDKTSKCRFCGIGKQSMYIDPSQREQYAYEFIHTYHLALPRHLSKIFKGDKNMKFDIIIGNPPYQLKTTSNSSQSIPIYQKFVEQAMSLEPKYICMIIPSRWFAGGMGLDSFRETMLKNRHIKLLVDWVNAKDCFPTLSIGGGVCYFLYDKDYEGVCEVTNIHNGEKSSLKRGLDEFGDVFVRHNDAIKILRKIKEKKETSFEKHVSSLSPFGIDSKERGHQVQKPNDKVLFSSEGTSFIDDSCIKTGKEMVNQYKIMVSKVTAEHAGEPDKNGQFKVLSTTKMINPNEVCTFSYFVVGASDDKNITENILKYMKTKFFRFLLLLSVTSINLSKDKFRFIPSQDFSKVWTDDELFTKYNINKEEQDYINSLIKEMV